MVALLVGTAIGIYLGSTDALQRLNLIQEDPSSSDNVTTEYSHVLGVVESASSTEVSIQRCGYLLKGQSVVFLLDGQLTQCDVALTEGKRVYVSYKDSYQNHQSDEPYTALLIEDADGRNSRPSPWSASTYTSPI